MATFFNISNRIVLLCLSTVYQSDITNLSGGYRGILRIYIKEVENRAIFGNKTDNYFM